MNIEQFENEFPDFYIEFGYCASGQLPDSINVPNLLSVDEVTQLDDLAAVIREHAHRWQYFVVLSWRSLSVGKYPCSHAEYDAEIIPPAAIAAAQNYTPPILLD